ncbi:Flp pilus assembly protein CpaB [Vibrio sp. 10N.286.49.B3]|uniref:Flp pilus assembly protein CpaB n=1 Tax=Vibrio sp. 10N.286.49.B3 TaxID=1880855 RepID=UPI000C8569EB|nr:Flp pilus assembly protein CpaB [Vibrio sp. 10N.286.49.B3]PMH46710.1 Flp pilus assembly protein CpaB [Vibrio sp. 10N.286.49.B3]
MKTKIITLIAGLVILVGLYGLANNLTGQQIVESVVAPEPVVEEVKFKVWRINQDVELGQYVKRSDFTLEVMLESDAHRIGVDQDMSADFSLGAVYRTDAPQGTLLFAHTMVQPRDAEYIDFIITPDMVPFAIGVKPKSIIGGVIGNGTLIDVLALTLPQELASIEVTNASNQRKRQLSVAPVLMNIKVLKVEKTFGKEEKSDNVEKVDLILELTRKQVAKLTVAGRIAELEVHKSIGDYKPADLKANAGDILADFKSITEFRASDAQIR